ncbi:hypothetical protein N9273_00295 [bacterium]|nr:hypothetical protein [bacterium]
MSTILIDTKGGSKFLQTDNIVNSEAGAGQALGDLNITLSNTDGRPILKPQRKVIDVVNDFSWYAGPQATSTALDKVPCAFLVEREQILSSLVSGSLYYLNSTVTDIEGVLKNSKFLQGVLGKVQDSTKKIIESGTNILKNTLRDFTTSATDRALLKQNNLNSLQGIYFTKPTGFQYRLPMYEQKQNVSGSWSDGHGRGMLAELIDSTAKTLTNISQAVNFAQPGVYIEKPQYFQGVGGRTETITFPLANTIRRGEQSPVQQNYELLWLLVFQNKAYKTSFARTPPPKIYSVNVPGQFSMPYAYISNLSVNFQGTVRNHKVYVPSGSGEGSVGRKQVIAPIPEAYQVTIQFTSLIKDYGNTMLGNDFSTSIIDNTVTFGN